MLVGGGTQVWRPVGYRVCIDGPAPWGSMMSGSPPTSFALGVASCDDEANRGSSASKVRVITVLVAMRSVSVGDRGRVRALAWAQEPGPAAPAAPWAARVPYTLGTTLPGALRHP